MSDSDISYFKLRYTFTPDTSKHFQEASSMIGIIGDVSYISIGFENCDKVGKPTSPHIHFHFTSHTKYDTLKKRIQRYLKDTFNGTRKGNSVYSLKLESVVEDETRFFRYPFKQSRFNPQPKPHTDFSRERSRLPNGFDIERQTELACEEYERDIEFNLKKLENVLKPNTKDKLFKYLDKIHADTPFTSRKDILTHIITYYAQEEKSANKQTIIGFTTTAMLKYQLITAEQLSIEWDD